MDRLLIVETLLPEKMLNDLKTKTGENTNKGALAKAISHYLECFIGKKQSEVK